MKRLFITSSLLFCSLLATAQRKTPFYIPPADTAKNKLADTSKYKKGINIAGVKPDYALVKKRILSKITLSVFSFGRELPYNRVEIFYSYDDKDKLTKIEYKHASGPSRTEYLFYDEQKRIYLIVSEETRTSGPAEKPFFLVISYEDNSRVMSVSFHNTLNQRTSRYTFRYEGDDIIRTLTNERNGNTSEARYIRTAGGENILHQEVGINTTDNVDFLQLRDPTSFLPQVYCSIYRGDIENISYFMGNKNAVYTSKNFGNGLGMGRTHVTESYTTNAYGWIDYIRRYNDNDRSVFTDIKYEYQLK